MTSNFLILVTRYPRWANPLIAEHMMERYACFMFALLLALASSAQQRVVELSCAPCPSAKLVQEVMTGYDAQARTTGNAQRLKVLLDTNVPLVTCWGTGTPLREFLHVDDLGEACVFALEHWQPGPNDIQHLNVGTGVDLTIRELAEAVAAATGFSGEIRWDASQPDGTPKKQLDVSRGWRAQIPLAEGLVRTVAAFRAELGLF